MKSFTLQQGQSDCGVACLSSVIRYYGGETTIEKLREISGTSTRGTTLLGLCQAAVLMGFDAEGMAADSVDNLSELNGPAILHVIIENHLQHYLVFYAFNADGTLLIGNPAKGI